MPIGVTQAVCSETGFASPISLDFTTDFVTHEGAGAASDPAAGSTLIVLIQSTANITAVATNQSDTGVEDYAPGGGAVYWRIEDISAGVTGITITADASATPQTFILELDTSVVENDNAAWAATGNGFSASQDYEYTTTQNGELVVAYTYANTANREFLDGTVGTVLAFSTSENRALIYAIIPTAGTGNIDWNMSSAQTFSASLVSYQEAGGGGGVPLAVFLNANQIIG